MFVSAERQSIYDDAYQEGYEKALSIMRTNSMDNEALLQIYGLLVQELLSDTGAEVRYKGTLYMVRPSKGGEFGSRVGIEIFEMNPVEFESE